MWFPFFKKLTPAEEKKRMPDECIRQIEKYRKGLQEQEKKLLLEIKESAQKGQTGVVKIITTELVRTRNQIEKYRKHESQLHQLSLRFQ